MVPRTLRNVGEVDAFARGWACAILVVGGFVAYFAIPPIEVARIVALVAFGLSLPLGVTAKLRFSPLYWLAGRSTRSLSKGWDPRTAGKRRQREGHA